MKKKLLTGALAVAMACCVIVQSLASGLPYGAGPVLSSLTHNAPNTGVMLPSSFSPYQTHYLLTVASWVSRVRFTPSCADPNCTITVNGQSVRSGSQSQIIEMTDKPQSVSIIVADRYGGRTEYTVYLQRRPSERRTRVSSGYIEALRTSGGKNYIDANLVTVTYTPNTNLSTFYDDTYYLYKYACSANCMFYYGTIATAYRATDFNEFKARYRMYGSNLYTFVYIEDEIVMVTPYESDVAPTAAPTATPYASILLPVYYVSASGSQLYVDYLNLNYGSNTVRADDSKIPYGYRLLGSRTASVYVSYNGTKTPSSVTFTYAAPATATPFRTATPAPQAVLPVYYVGSGGEQLYVDYLTLNYGTNTVYANDSLVPWGYTLIGSRTATVYVSSYSTATPQSVTFTYRSPVKQTPTPTAVPQVTIPIYYVTGSGTLLYTDYLTLNTGFNMIYANDANVPANYLLSGSRTAYVSVGTNGVPTPGSVTFTYAYNPPATPTPTLRPKLTPTPTPVPTPNPYLSVFFNARYYAEMYPDLQATFGNDEAALFNHWLNNGMSEGRKGSPAFDPIYYMETYPDIIKTYGKSNYAGAHLHYYENGVMEGRRGSATFDVNRYIELYPDVEKQFLGNKRDCAQHYNDMGYYEGRQGI